MMERLGFLIGLGLLEHFNIPKVFGRGFDMLFSFINSKFMEFQDEYLVLFHLFSVLDNFVWFWIGSFCSYSRLHSWSFTFPTIH